MKLSSPGSATIVNAITTGFGSAFGIGLDITVIAKTKSSGISCENDVGASNDLMELCIKNTLLKYSISSDDFGMAIKTKSKLPMASGLSSSSALSNGVVALTSKLIANEFDLKPLNDLSIINLAIDSSIEANATITGAFDDATASYFGGVTLTNNKTREFIRKDKFEDKNILIYMPNYTSESSDVNVSRMKVLAPLVNKAFEMASLENYYSALNLNGLIHASLLNFDNSVAIEALSAGALASGLSGTGSSFVAICENESIDDVKDVWSSFEGRILETTTNNKGLLSLIK